MKKIKKEILSILFYISSIINMNNVYAATQNASTNVEKIGFGIYLAVAVLILASLCTYFHLRITRIKSLESKDKKLVLNFNKSVRAIRWIFIAVTYIAFIINVFSIMITVMYCLEGLGKSLTDIVIYSPMSAATQHFIETILLSGFIVIFANIEHLIIRNKIKKSNEYNNEEKEILLKHYK